MSEATPIINPKRPSGDGWTRLSNPPAWVTMGYDAERWFYEPVIIEDKGDYVWRGLPNE